MLRIFNNIIVRIYAPQIFHSRKKCTPPTRADPLMNPPHTVRVRFAPSPTGYLHLGGLRTALYNYLFARSKNGKFVLRIEDTDQTRIIEGATEQLCKDLEWAGIQPDEGPVQGGRYGPYVQSERLDIYRREIKKLLENGSAYYCFCTERRLELLRKEALRTRQVPKYDNRCRHLTPVQIAAKLANQEQFCIRFKLDPFLDEYHDLVYGNIIYDVAENEGDPVLIKSDGYPTYHFANVVDDHFMNITHVLRGVEWQISTTKHLLIYKAFNWKPPQFAHLPLLLNADGSKLSKRQGNINIEHYRSEMGIHAPALINYITQTGGGFDKQQQKLQNFSIEKLQTMFDIKKINVNSSRLNPALLSECNRLQIIAELKDPKKCNKLVTKMQELVKESYPNEEQLDIDADHVKDVLNWAAPRITSLKDLVVGDLLFVWVLPKNNRKLDLCSGILEKLICELENVEEFSKNNLNNKLKEFSENNQLQYNNFMRSLRSILSGLKVGPGVADMMEILGKQTTIQRIRLIQNPNNVKVK